MKHRLAILALLASFALAPAVIAAPQTADEQLYTQTVATMRALPQPAYAQFVATLSSEGLGDIQLLDSGDGRAKIVLSGGKSRPAASWPVSYRTADDFASIQDKPGAHLVSHSPIFSPTWGGVYDWMRFGISGRPNTPVQNSTPTPDPSETTSPGIAVIGIAQVIGISFYRISQADEAVCPSGAQGRHLHLEPHADPLRHPLTDVTIDTAAGRFCSMRFHLEVHGGLGFALNATAVEELHFGEVHGYWMTTSSDADILQRAFGIGLHHATLHLTYEDMRFPDSMDEALFLPKR